MRRASKGRKPVRDNRRKPKKDKRSRKQRGLTPSPYASWTTRFTNSLNIFRKKDK